VYPTSKPICFAISFTNTNRSAKKDISGDGACLFFLFRPRFFSAKLAIANPAVQTFATRNSSALPFFQVSLCFFGTLRPVSALLFNAELLQLRFCVLSDSNATKILSILGIMVVSHNKVEVYNMSSKIIDSAELVRQPEKTPQAEHTPGNHQKVFLASKSREVFLCEGNTLKIKNKIVSIKFMVPWEDYHKGSFFLKTFKETEAQDLQQKAIKDIKFVDVSLQFDATQPR
jgi:hypothetical protein